MKVVLDTNIIMSGIIWAGVPAKILQAWSENIFSTVVTQEIIEQYIRIGVALQKKHPYVNIFSILDILLLKSETVKAASLPSQICTDPDDDKFLACALSAHSKIIVSGDKALLKVKEYQGVQILTAKNFLDEYC